MSGTIQRKPTSPVFLFLFPHLLLLTFYLLALFPCNRMPRMQSPPRMHLHGFVPSPSFLQPRGAC